MKTSRHLMTILAFFIMATKALFGEDLVLSTHGQSNYDIVIPESPSAVENQAAEELANHLQAISGCRFAVIRENAEPMRKHAILVGNTQAARSLVTGSGLDALPPDSIIISTRGQDLILSGHPQRGALYAVFTFLEDELGVRWWSSGESDIPQHDTITVKEQDRRYSPPVIVREAFYYDPWQHPVFAARCRTNGHFAEIPENYGGHQKFIDFVHTFSVYLPPSVYFQEHPEWYALRNGARLNGNTQLCLTNPEMQKEFIRNVLEKVQANPGLKMISLSQNDNYEACQCENCLAVDREEGAQSGTLLRFVNKVAEAVAEVRPDMMVETLAYQYTRKPPKMTRPAANVIVRLCNIECDYAQSMEEGVNNADFREDIQAWSKIAPQLYIWNYTTNFKDYIFPYANWRHFASDIRFFVRHNAVAIFEQGDYGSVHGDFVRARFWVLAHLLWNPELDQSELEKEFFRGYYGPAGDKLLACRDFLEECSISSGAPLYCLRTKNAAWLSPDNLLKAYELYQEAEKMVEGQEPFAGRVRRDRLSLDHALLRYVPLIRRQAAVRGQKTALPFDPVQMAREWEEMTLPDEEWREGGKIGNYPRQLLQLVAEEPPIPEECLSLPADDFDVFEENRFVLYREGVESILVNDENSANGKAILLPGSFHNWSVQVPLEPIYRSGKWRFHFAVRTENAPDDGNALSVGIYDYLPHQPLFELNFQGQQVNGQKYTVITSEPFGLPDGQLVIWVQPWAGNVYVDRIWMSHE